MRQLIRRNIILFPYFNFFRYFYANNVIMMIYLSMIFKSYTKAMAILTIHTISQSVMEVPTGILSDKVGRKWTMSLATITLTIQFLMAIFGVLSESYFFFVLFAILSGTGQAFYSGADRALLFESLRELKKKHKYHNAFGKIEAISQLSLVIASIVGGIIAEKSYLLVFVICLISQIIAFVITLFFIEPKKIERSTDNPFKHFTKAVKLIIKNKKLRNISIAKMMFHSGSSVSHVFQPVFFKLLIPLWLVGFARAFKKLMSTLSYWFSGKVIDKFNRIKTLIASILIMFTNNLVSILLNLPISPFLMACGNIVYGIKQTSESSIFQDEFSDKQRATMSSIIALFTNLLFGVLSILIGYVADLTSIQVGLILAECFVLISAIIYYKNLRLKN